MKFQMVFVLAINILLFSISEASPLLLSDTDDAEEVEIASNSTRLRRNSGSGISSRCQPDPRSSELGRRSLCPFQVQLDTDPLRVPDVIARTHCLCESSLCSTSGGPHSRCVSVVSPLKVAYLDPQLKYVVSTEVIHLPVACVCANSITGAGRHMPVNRNIVV